MVEYFDPVNLGPYTLRRTVLNFLRDRLPPYIELIRIQHPEFDQQLLPDVGYWDAYDPYTAKSYPAIGMYVNGSDDYVMDDDTSFTGAQVYTAVYDTSIFVATRTAFLGTDDAGVAVWEQPERDSAMRIRDIYMGAIKSVLFNEPSFGTAGEDVGLTKLQRGTYQEILPDPLNANGRFVASGVATANIEHRETTVPPVYGYFHNLDADVKKIDDSSPPVEQIDLPDEE